jgi:hypothetical protein
MLMHYARGAMLAFCFATGCTAGELAEFNAAVEQASAHYRTALHQLSSGDAEHSLAEVGHLRKHWAALVDRFGEKRPDAFDANESYATVLTGVGKRIATALTLISARRLEPARTALAPIRVELSQMRRASGVMVLADCILDANAAMDALAIYKDKPPDWSKPETRFDNAAKATIYGHELKDCQDLASNDVRADPHFQKLIDGALAGVALVPTAIATRDSDLFARILSELRAFDRQLALRYG